MLQARILKSSIDFEDLAKTVQIPSKVSLFEFSEGLPDVSESARPAKQASRAGETLLLQKRFNATGERSRASSRRSTKSPGRHRRDPEEPNVPILRRISMVFKKICVSCRREHFSLPEGAPKIYKKSTKKGSKKSPKRGPKRVQKIDHF